MSTEHEQRKDQDEDREVRYELSPPEGGWGYVVASALALACNVTLVPLTCFGIIYGNFLSQLGDETTGTTLANGIFNTFFNFTGLAANHFLQKYSYRAVGMIGAIVFFVGNFSTIFVTNLTQLIVSFGMIQGFGIGLMFPAFFTALNSYFDKRLNSMNGLAQALMVAASMAFPFFGKYLMDNFGFRGTVAVLSALSLNSLLAATTLQPVERHMKKREINVEGGDNPQLKPLLSQLKEQQRDDDEVHHHAVKYVLPKPRTSIISVGDRALSVTTINHLGKLHHDAGAGNNCFKSLAKSLDLGMFLDPVYVNITMGLSLGFTSDVAFISLIPLILTNAGFDTTQVTLMMTIYFGSDLVSRLVLSVICALCKVNNRYLFLGGCLTSAIFRTLFVMRNTYMWKMATLSILGFLRGFVQTPLPTVIADEYSHKFSTAFSLYMVVCGFVSLIFGPLMSFVKTRTQDDVMVVHLLSLAYFTCAATWTIELMSKTISGNAKT